MWQENHPTEAQILELLDEEFRHKPHLIQPRRAKLFEEAQQARRALGFGDHLVLYVNRVPFLLEELLAQDGVALPEGDLMLLQQVNHGFWAKAGFFTKGVRRLEDLK